jgi:hypothetical protein
MGGAICIVAHYLGDYLLSISSATARQAFSSTDLYEEAIRPLLVKHPELVREATIQIATILVDDMGNELKDKDDALMLPTFYSLRCLLNDAKLSRFLPADQLEAARKTLEEAIKLYEGDPDLYDYLNAAYDKLVMRDR